MADVTGNVLGSLMGQLGDLLGKDALKGVMEFMGTEGFSAMVKGGTSLMEMNQTKDFMNFQKDLMTNAEARTQTTFNDQQADRTAMQNIDWTPDVGPAPALTQYT